MARVGGENLSSLTLAGVSILADTLELNPPISVEMRDTHTLGDTWKEATAGLKGGDDWTLKMFYNNSATTGSWALLTGLLGSTATQLVFSDGTRSVSGQVLVSNVAPPITVGAMVLLNATLRLTGSTTLT